MDLIDRPQAMTRMTCRDEYGNADIIGLEDVIHGFMLTLDYKDIVRLTEALNRFADLEESKIEALQAQKTGKWIHHKSPNKQHTGILECPFCGWEEVDIEQLKFCARCGARMEEE